MSSIRSNQEIAIRPEPFSFVNNEIESNDERVRKSINTIYIGIILGLAAVMVIADQYIHRPLITSLLVLQPINDSNLNMNENFMLSEFSIKMSLVILGGLVSGLAIIIFKVLLTFSYNNREVEILS